MRSRLKGIHRARGNDGSRHISIANIQCGCASIQVFVATFDCNDIVANQCNDRRGFINHRNRARNGFGSVASIVHSSIDHFVVPHNCRVDSAFSTNFYDYSAATVGRCCTWFYISATTFYKHWIVAVEDNDRQFGLCVALVCTREGGHHWVSAQVLNSSIYRNGDIAAVKHLAGANPRQLIDGISASHTVWIGTKGTCARTGEYIVRYIGNASAHVFTKYYLHRIAIKNRYGF